MVRFDGSDTYSASFSVDIIRSFMSTITVYMPIIPGFTVLSWSMGLEKTSSYTVIGASTDIACSPVFSTRTKNFTIPV
jgi:hypothetical protein